MLTTATKKKIDTARDILVGKIPMPTSQVEQITLALIYKFMSDMDKKAKDLGATSGFFANGYEKYAWGKLMDKALPARDRVLLYREALEKMALNPHIPQLFRDVFRNASLPFNDPETLKLFLDVIDQFEYDHSEELGNAFEYLLQVMGSQGDAGQFRTPRHIIDFIVEVVEPKKTDKILDPACGTAGFLISAYKYLKQQGLSNDELGQISDNFVGYDISQDMQRLSLVNMYLHHFPNPHIYEYDTLSSEDRWNDDFDVILANPPFMSPKGGIRPHNRFSVPSTRSEVLFVDYIMEHLSAVGKAGVIVPEGIIFQSQNTHKALRKMMVDNDYLWAVVSLPAGVFNPYAGVKTSILLFDREIAKKTSKILFVKVNNDGFDLGAQRREIGKNDLPESVKLLKHYKQFILSDTEVELSAYLNFSVVEKKEVRDDNYNLSAEKYKVKSIDNSQYPIVPLHEAAEVNPLKSKFDNASANLDVSFVPMSVLNENSTNFTPKETRKFNDVKSGYTNFREKDVLLAKITPCFENGKAGIAQYLLNGIGFGSTEFHVLRARAGIIDPAFLYYLITSSKFRDAGKMNMTGSAGQKRVPTDFVKTFKIPLPPFPVQQEIVEELDRYQKIIDGAKQVIDSWTPEIKLNPKWKMVRLDYLLSELEAGVSVNSENRTKTDGEFGVLKTSSVTYGVFNPNEHKAIFPKEKTRAKINPKKDNIIISRMNTEKLVGASAYIDNDYPDLFLPDRLWQTVRKRTNFSMKYLFYVLSSSPYRHKISDMSGGTSGSMKNISKKALLNIEIPLPSYETQISLVQNIENEARLIQSNVSLISKYREKIISKVNEVWGK